MLLVKLYGSFIHLIRQESEVNHIIILEIQGNFASYPLEIQGCFDDLPLEKKGKTIPGWDCPSHLRKGRNVKSQKAKWRCAMCIVGIRFVFFEGYDPKRILTYDPHRIRTYDPTYPDQSFFLRLLRVRFYDLFLQFNNLF